MSFLGKMAAALFGPSESLSRSDGWFVRMLGGGQTKAGVDVNEHLALYLPVVFACINRIANPIASFPLGIYERNAAGSAVAVTSHPLSQRLGVRPNDFMSSRTWRKTTMSHALRWGNGYTEIERDNTGQAVGLYPLLPDRTAPRKEGDQVNFRTNVGGTQFDIPGGDVLHLMDLSHDGYVGLSQVALARQAIGLGLATEEFGAKFFSNDAKSGGFLMHPGKLGPQATTNIRTSRGKDEPAPENPASRLSSQGGLDKAHRIKVLEEGMKFVSTTIPPEDAQFLGTREFQIAEIARMYDVPLILLQSHEGTTAWGTGIEQLMIGFVRQTISPWVDALEQEMNWKLFTTEERKRGLYVKFNMNALLRGDSAARAEFYKSLFGVAGFSPNKILELEDMDGIGPEGDVHFVPVNFQPISRAINPTPPLAPTVTETA